MIRAVLFDLDDTLYDQQRWLLGAWKAVASAAAEPPFGVAKHEFLVALLATAAKGSDQGRIIDRALARVGRPDIDPAPLVAAFRRTPPVRLNPYPYVRAGLGKLRRAGIRTGVVTDGDPGIQGAKLEALGLRQYFDVVVFSDELGRSHRKPHPAPFLVAVSSLGLHPGDVVFVGDRPEKDTRGAIAAGLQPIRVRTGEYRHLPDDPAPWIVRANVREAIATILTLHPARAPLDSTTRIS